MEQDITVVSIDKIKQHAPNMLCLDNSLLIDDTEYGLKGGCTQSIYKHPLRLDGVMVSIRLKGAGRIRINLTDYDVQSNDAFVCTTGDLIQVVQNTPRHQSLLIMISKDFIKDMFLNLKDSIPYFEQKDDPIVHLSQEDINALRTSFLFLKEAVTSTDFFKIEIIKRLLGAFLYKFGSILYTNRPKKEESNAPLKREEIIYKQFLSDLTKYHRKERRVEFYAEQLCLSPKHFSCVIKNVSGKTAGYWINEYVILEAKTLLKYTTMTIQEVSYFLNFPNPSFFGKYFKQHTGYTPTAYREKP